MPTSRYPDLSASQSGPIAPVQNRRGLHARSEVANLAHEKVVCMLRDTLRLGGGHDLEPYWGLAVVIRTKLTRSERQCLAWAAMMACEDQEAEGIAEAVLEPQDGAGWPMVPFADVVEQASFWADMASPNELRAYAGVCFARLAQAKGNAA